MNPDHLSRVFNKYTGKKINEYINAIRIDEAKKMLKNSKYKITEIAISVGFDNLRTFYISDHNRPVCSCPGAV